MVQEKARSRFCRHSWTLRRASSSACAVAIAGSLFTAGAGPVLLYAQARTVWDGVYSEVQAGRGRSQYAIYCSACHGASLRGGLDGVEQAPPLRRDDFMRSRGNLGNLYDYVKKSMPRDEPGTLRDADYADVVAYLLRENGYPAGAQALPADSIALAGIRIVDRPAGDPSKD